jgi:alkylhydroperoxidase/carboxymuconolactone decarboxylase family protein YurZ
VNDLEDRLRRLATDDASFTGDAVEAVPAGILAPDLDDRTAALVRLAALIALGAPPASYRSSVERIHAAGATVDEAVGTLLAVAPTVGFARVVAATSPLALAIGYDIDDALERLNLPLECSSSDLISGELPPQKRPNELSRRGG